MSSRPSPTTSACSRAPAGTPARPRRSAGPTPIESLSFGGALKGTSWGRPNDQIGVSGVVEGLSREARAYFAAGGLGILIGDGALNYRPERVVEAFYAYSVNKVATLTFDYQYFVNPAYNADRGPVSIFSDAHPRGMVTSAVPILFDGVKAAFRLPAR